MSVAIVITTKGDRPAFLAEAFDSVRSQGAYPIVVVDADAIDFASLPMMLMSWKHGALVHHKGPHGRAHAANAGVATLGAGKWKYVGFLDDDDVLLPGHVQKLADALNAHPEHGVAYSDVELVRCTSANKPQLVVKTWEEPFTREQLLAENQRPNMAMLYRRKLLAKHPLDPKWWPFDDWDLLVRVASAASFLHVPGITAQYRLRSDGTNAIQGAQQKTAEELRERNRRLFR